MWEGERIIILAARYTAHANKGRPLGCFFLKRGRRWCHQCALSELRSEGAGGGLGVASSGRLWGPGVNPWLCQGPFLRRLLSHHTFVALRARPKGLALCTSHWDAMLIAFWHSNENRYQQSREPSISAFYKFEEVGRLVFLGKGATL